MQTPVAASGVASGAETGEERDGAPATRSQALTELADFSEIGAVQHAYHGGRKLEVEEIDGKFVFEGDILLPSELVRFEEPQLILEPGEAPASLSEYNRLTARTETFWPDGIVPYAINPALPNQQRVTDAIAHWEANTTLTFVPRTTEADYIYFQPSTGCSSYIGKIGGQQPVNLADACSTGNTIHEIGHAIGLWHEHSRVDRDDHIAINWSNIASGREHNFQTYIEQGWDGGTFTSELDFGSIMMYGSYSFSNNGLPTIVRADGSTFNIQRSGLSPDDIAGVARLYPEGGGEPQWVNGEYYFIAGANVLRYRDRWYFSTKYGWKIVEYRDGYWWYV